MSEKIYACLLRLYPAHFRREYGEEALLLFRNRMQDERGFFPRLRLWLDIFADLAISVPRAYQHVPEAKLAASDGMFLFHSLENEMPSFRYLFYGGVVSCILCGGVLFAAARGHSHFPLPDSDGQHRPSYALSPTAVPAESQPDGSPGNGMDDAERHRVIMEMSKVLRTDYVYSGMAEKMVRALSAHESNGDYGSLSNGSAFAAQLTTDLRSVSHDRHLAIRYNVLKTSDGLPVPSPEILAHYREDMERSHCTFEKVEILSNNIGYLQFSEFPDPSLCGSTMSAVMSQLNHASAIIFDLRQNGGGDPKMVSLIATYLFDHPTHLNDVYSPKTKETKQYWTSTPIPGNRLANKPVYVLTSSTTFSGAEEFSYDLQSLKRATIVGESTAGAAHIVRAQRLDDHFTAFIPFARPINPISKTDWEGTGVEPDVKVKAADALMTAERLAENRLRRR